MRLEGDIFIEEKSPNMLIKSQHVGFSPSRSLSIVRKKFVTSHVLSIVSVILRHLVHSQRLGKTGNQAINVEIVNILKLHSNPNYPQKGEKANKFYLLRTLTPKTRSATIFVIDRFTFVHGFQATSMEDYINVIQMTLFQF